jgi:hypothetical protein
MMDFYVFTASAKFAALERADDSTENPCLVHSSNPADVNTGIAPGGQTKKGLRDETCLRKAYAILREKTILRRIS